MAGRKDYHQWTPADEQRALALWEDDMGYEDIAIELGITPGAAKARIERLCYGGRVPDREPKRQGYVDPDLIADRDARKAAAGRRDQTAEFFGDPPPGFSELDKRRGSS